MRMLVQVTLENMGGLRVSLCENGIDVLETALTQAPQMIILDVMMAGMDGPDILREIRADDRLSAIPVIFLTARTDRDDEYRAMGAAGVIHKPFDLTALTGQIKTLWESYHGR